MDTASTGSLAISSIIAFFFPLPPPPPAMPTLPPPASPKEEEVARRSGDVGENSKSSKDLYLDEVTNRTLVSCLYTLVCSACTLL
jgi:hypothetical protein